MKKALAAGILLAAFSGQPAGPATEPFAAVPDPLAADNPVHHLAARPQPAVGESFRDEAFGTSLSRVTATALVDGQPSGRHEYSRHDPFNRDQSLVLLLPEGAWRVYRTATQPYNAAANLVATLEDIAEPRWDRVEPGVVWGLRGFQVLAIDVTTGQETVVKDFRRDAAIAVILAAEPDIYRITTKDEGEPSLDRRYWAFELQGSKDDYRARYIIAWDREADRVLGVRRLQRSESDIDWVGMSPKGAWVLVGGAYDNGGGLAGLTIAPKDLSRFYRIDYATAHADVGLDTDGNEVVVMQSERTDYVDLLPLDPATKPILTGGGGYAGTNRTRLVRLDYDSDSPFTLGSGLHVSCNVPGYCVVSTTTERGVAERNWLDRTVVLLRLDRQNPRAFYLAKVHNTTADYWEETHGAITNDGSRVVWASNWGQNAGRLQMSLIGLRMPDGWNHAPNVTVLAPNGGQRLRAGSFVIGWTATGIAGPVKIEFSTDGGLAWRTIADSAPNTGRYTWAVPDVASTTCLVRISAASNSRLADASDAFFSIER
jgi:hypothetical protein